jgi:uncharacterized protein (DUF1499 family)
MKWLGMVCLCVISAVIVFSLMPWPRINDITTSFQNPPTFVAIKNLNPGRNYDYPKKFEVEQSGHYKDLSPLQLPSNARQVFEKVVAVAREIPGWSVVATDPENLRIEAVATTRLLRFKDDVVIEIRPVTPGISEVHMRSKSRLGRGDLGANAKRIKMFFDKLR